MVRRGDLPVDQYERRFRFANIQTGKKSFLGRCGLGAVMGSKRLKGVAIRGKRKISLYDFDEVDRLNREINRRLYLLDAEKPELLRASVAGTARATERFALQGNLPIKNFPLGTFPEGVGGLGDADEGAGDSRTQFQRPVRLGPQLLHRTFTIDIVSPLP